MVSGSLEIGAVSHEFLTEGKQDRMIGMPVTEFVREGGHGAIDVFVVSSNVKLRETLQGKLDPSRWNVVEAGSGAGALEVLYRHGDADGVLLLDPMLPDLDPVEFHAMIRSRFPQLQVVTLNSRTGQLLVGETALTPASKWLLDLLNAEGGCGLAVSGGLRGEVPRRCGEGAREPARDGGGFRADAAGV